MKKSDQGKFSRMEIGRNIWPRQNQDQFDPLGGLARNSRAAYPAPGRRGMFVNQAHPRNQAKPGRHVNSKNSFQQGLIVEQAYQKNIAPTPATTQ